MYIIIISTPNFPYFHHFLECIIGTTKLPIDLIVPYTFHLFLPGAVHTGSLVCSTPAMCISHQFDVCPVDPVSYKLKCLKQPSKQKWILQAGVRGYSCIEIYFMDPCNTTWNWYYSANYNL